MPWFRMYSEARNDRKLASLSDAQFRVWFNLLCLASESKHRGLVTYDDAELLAFEVANENAELLNDTLAKLQKLRIIEHGSPDDSDDFTIRFVHWESRQYDKPSATPERVNERVTKHRETKRNADVTHMKRDVTPCNTTEEKRVEESRVEKNTNPPKSPKGDPVEFVSFYDTYPRHTARQDALKSWQKINPSPELIQEIMDGLNRLLPDYRAREPDKVPHPSTFLNGQRWRDEPVKKQGSVLDGTKPAFVNGHQNYTAEEGREIRRRAFGESSIP